MISYGFKANIRRNEETSIYVQTSWPAKQSYKCPYSIFRKKAISEATTATKTCILFEISEKLQNTDISKVYLQKNIASESDGNGEVAGVRKDLWCRIKWYQY